MLKKLTLNYDYLLLFVLFVLFLIRLENINILPFDEHASRQTLTLSIARNMEDLGFDFFRPSIDFGENAPKHIVCEAPIFNTLIFLANKLFGPSHWYGRLINLVVSTTGVWFFYAFLKKYFTQAEAFSASVIFAVSLYFLYSRKTMPDTFALSLVFMGNYAGMRYLSGGRWTYLVGFGLFSCLGMLSKLPMSCAVILLLVPFLEEKNSHRKLAFCAAGILSVAGMALWYFVWMPYLEKHDKAFTLYEIFPLKEGWRQFWLYPKSVWEQFSQSHLRSWISFSMLVPGFFYLFLQKKWTLLAVFMAYFLCFFYFIISAGYVYPSHEYYGIPFTPMMSIVAGFGLANLLQQSPRLILPLLLVISVEAIGKQKSDFWVLEKSKKYLNLESIADKFSVKTDRFITTPGLNFPVMYMLNRKGDGASVTTFKEHPDWILDARRLGFKYIFVEKNLVPDSLLFPVVYDDENFRAYKY